MSTGDKWQVIERRELVSEALYRSFGYRDRISITGGVAQERCKLALVYLEFEFEA
jgi:hypothetical protein